MIVYFQIGAVDINFWNRSFKEFKVQEIDSYPPRVSITVSRMRQTEIFLVNVLGCVNNLEYELVVLSGRATAVVYTVLAQSFSS